MTTKVILQIYETLKERKEAARVEAQKAFDDLTNINRMREVGIQELHQIRNEAVHRWEKADEAFGAFLFHEWR